MDRGDKLASGIGVAGGFLAIKPILTATGISGLSASGITSALKIIGIGSMTGGIMSLALVPIGFGLLTYSGYKGLKYLMTILRTVFKQCYWRWLHSHKGPGTEGLNFSKLYPWAKCREIRSSRCWLKVWPLQTDHSRPWQGFTVLLTRFQFTQGESTR